MDSDDEGGPPSLPQVEESDIPADKHRPVVVVPRKAATPTAEATAAPQPPRHNPADDTPTRHLVLTWARVIRKKTISSDQLAAELAADIEPGSGALTSVRILPSNLGAHATFTSAAAAASIVRKRHATPFQATHAHNIYFKYAEVDSQHGSAEGKGDEAPELTASRRMPIAADVAHTEGVHVPGLVVIEDFITEAEERQLIDYLDAVNDSGESRWLNTISRRVQHYGWTFNYDTRLVDTDRRPPPYPHEFEALKDKIVAVSPPGGAFDQLTFNEYLPGQGIAPHVDTHSAFEECIAIVSLVSAVVMKFVHPTGSFKYVLLQPRSLVMMTGEARYHWTHGIPQRTTDVINGAMVMRQRRVSATFRTIRSTPCDCQWPAQCDSQGSALAKQAPVESSVHAVPDIEREHVHKLYDAIAAHFSSTRYAGWPKINQVVESAPLGSLILDIGCGNGKYLAANPSAFAIGVDRSVGLIDICGQRGFNAAVADALMTPFRSDIGDLVLSIAVLHHISTYERRRAAVQELIRVARPGGTILVSVWAMEQEADSKRAFESQDCMVPWCLQERFVDKEQLAAAHGVVDQDRHVVILNRYCHVYREGELEELFRSFSNVTVLESWFDKSNWVVKAQKLPHP